MHIEWLYDEDTDIEVAQLEVYEAIDEMSVGQRLEDGFAILCMN